MMSTSYPHRLCVDIRSVTILAVIRNKTGQFLATALTEFTMVATVDVLYACDSILFIILVVFEPLLPYLHIFIIQY